MGKFAGFQSVKLARPKRSEFDLSHMIRSSTRMGRLTPVFVTECIPSDTFHGSSEILLRLAPLLAPIYDNIQLYVHFFFVPNRLLWTEWEPFITGGRLGTEEAPIPPYFDIGTQFTKLGKSSLADYLGCPIFSDLGAAGAYAGKTIDAMPFLAYQKIWYDYYRDRNYTPDDVYPFMVTNTAPMGYPSGECEDDTVLDLHLRAYEHDYFTSALPFTQRGDEVLMPLSGSGSVTYLDASIMKKASDGSTAASGAVDVLGDPATIRDGSDNQARIENIDEVLIDASSVSVNDVRTAFALQVWLERNAVGGSRYNENTEAHFGIKPQDQRMQRAEYLGGGRIAVKISEVVSTAYSNDGELQYPLGNMGGHGVTYGNTNSFRFFCPEHGFILGIASILNPPSYHQGLPRMFRRRSFLDYVWPVLSKLGEQQVDKAELYASAANLTEDSEGLLPLFGYQSRYADWKFIPNGNRGDFHDSLLFWTLTRDFASSPVLGNVFVTFDDASQDRIFAVNDLDTDNFWLYINNRVTVRRALPYFGTPNTFGFQ